MSKPIIVAITGGSGAPYARRLLQVLSGQGRDVHLAISQAGADVIEQELGVAVNLHEPDVNAIVGGTADSVRHFDLNDYQAPMASGSAVNDGMVVCPCSGNTIGAIASCTGSNLIHRAAQVQLKERRRLIVVPRETPVSLPMLEAMTKVTQAGAIVLPAAPGFYHQPRSIDDLVDFVVARILDHLDVPHELVKRWGTKE